MTGHEQVNLLSIRQNSGHISTLNQRCFGVVDQH